MEATLHARDQTGVQDFVLLEDYKSEDAFVDNLKKRFQENLIYTYIGPVLISVNPYKQLNIYDETIIETYRNVNFYELPPHIFAIADSAYRSMRAAFQDQCVLISGESGSGKTEASKKILQYIAASSTHSQEVGRVKDRLLQSNPVLEAFGNAKTNRNDNSSRFGKYMDVQFDFKGTPVGGVILNYLLEKSRVIHQAAGERNFHVFYQLVRGADSNLLDELSIRNDVEAYYYLNQGDCRYSGGYTSGTQSGTTSLETVDDAADWKVVQGALSVCGFSKENQKNLYSIVASILHLGNTGFVEEDGQAMIANTKTVEIIAKLLGCSYDDLVLALTYKSIIVQAKKVTSPLSREQAVYARDAFSKGVYERLFKWLVSRINMSLASKSQERKTVLGLLDIYGFEIFEANSFEQFCINYCNEKLQQLFITLTLKSEQEEYLREGIEWEPVKYFNNKIICDLVELKPSGIISLMDEECLRPGNPTDITFLDKLSTQLKDHAHYLSYATANVQQRRSITREEFRLVHYAGEVTYNVKGFLDKNNDTLFRDLKEVMGRADNAILKHCFPESELMSKKRPDTAGTQFRTSLAQLMEILLSKEPSYIRCIKPNDHKRPNSFDEEIIHHQVKYLGLMENLRVRRAGFAYRRQYELFLTRYKSLCPKTWPHFQGSPKEGVGVLCKHLKYGEDDYKMGKTKIFIRFPRVLFATEDALQARKQELATSIQALYKMYAARKIFLIKRNAVTKIANIWRMYTAKKLLERRRKAAFAIRKFIKGFTIRDKPLCEENRIFINYTRYNFLMRVKKALPKTVLDKSWPQAPQMLKKASEQLHKLNTGNLVKKYMLALTKERKEQFEEKVIAERIFKGKKETYPASVGRPFVDQRLDSQNVVLYNNVFKMSIKTPTELVKYVSPVAKFDSKGYKQRDRVFVATTEALYVLNQKDFKLKQKIPLSVFQGISVSPLSDNVFVIHTEPDKNNNKADVILSCDHLIEALTKVAIACGKEQAISFQNGGIRHKMISGKDGLIEFSKGDRAIIAKRKNGLLGVTVT